MIWDRNALFAKSKLFFQNAFEVHRESPLFGLWCSLGLELLARTALAHISPTLLAEPERDHKHLLHSLGVGTNTAPRSIGAAQAFSLCQLLIASFTADDQQLSNAMANRRNEELHTGGAAFESYPTGHWLHGFYRACSTLAESMGESLESIFGADEAEVARDVIEANKVNVLARVKKLIAAHETTYNEIPHNRANALKAKATLSLKSLSSFGHHRLQCPACSGPASVTGQAYGKITVSHENNEIVTRQAVSPTQFECTVCGLKLKGYAELEAARLGGSFTRRTTHSPESFFGLIDPDSIDIAELYHEHYPNGEGEFYQGGDDYFNE